ncbi:MAG: ATP-binding protein [Saprospiraceae bacterium]
MLVTRDISARLRELLAQYPVLALTGPRQSGKTTLLRNLFPEYRYVSLEEPFQREFAQNDPRGFLDMYDRFVIFDEAQRVPDLFSYIQTKTDNDRLMGQYILSGSQNFLLLEQITQSLAGRVSLFKLLPFSHAELAAHAPSLLQERPSEAIFWGGYPALYDRGIQHFDFFSDYIETYVERDVRNLLRVQDLTAFRNFVRLCASRIGTPLNLHSLAVDCGISNPTARAWMSLLESSYIVYLLPPYFRNFNKRIIKSHKLYFYDTGLACYLLGLTAPEQIENFHQRGSLFENMAILELLKNRINRKAPTNFYFWQDSNGVEVDLLVEEDTRTHLFEMKYSQTPHSEFSKGIGAFRKTAGQLSGDNTVVYAGDTDQRRSDANLLGWKALKNL